jgi:putative membrane protein
MFRYTRALALITLFGLASLALACDENGTGGYGTDKPTANKGVQATLSESDRAFANKASMGARQEVALGKLAAARTSNSDVKAFANRMVQDHTKAGEELMKVTSRLGIATPAEDEKPYKDLVDQLTKLSGAEFDRLYMNEMVRRHTDTLAGIDTFTTGANNADLKGWATTVTPTVREHLQMAKDISAKL